jgi:nucleoside-diphosphate-sugar epimerase
VIFKKMDSLNSREKVVICVLFLFLVFLVIASVFALWRKLCKVESAGSCSARFAQPQKLYSIPSPYPNGKRVIITGGAGFIGSQLGFFLHNKGYDVVLIDNMAYGYQDNLVVDGKRFGTFIKAEILDDRTHALYAGVDCVFHFAALSALPVCQSNPRSAMEVNVGGVANVMEASRIHGVRRFIFASTSAVYEGNTESVLTEDLRVNPHLMYSLSKYQGELLVKAVAATYDQDIVILRFFNVFGPHQDFRRKSPPFTSYITRELVHGRAPHLHSDGNQRRDYVYVTDLIDLAIRAMKHPLAAGQTFNVASGQAYSVNEMYNMVKEELASNISPMYHPPSNFWKAYPRMFQGVKPIKLSILENEVNKVVLGSNEKAKEILKWTPKVTMQDGLRNMVNYAKQLSKDVQMKSFDTAW